MGIPDDLLKCIDPSYGMTDEEIAVAALTVLRQHTDVWGALMFITQNYGEMAGVNYLNSTHYKDAELLANVWVKLYQKASQLIDKQHGITLGQAILQLVARQYNLNGNDVAQLPAEEANPKEA